MKSGNEKEKGVGRQRSVLLTLGRDSAYNTKSDYANTEFANG